MKRWIAGFALLLFLSSCGGSAGRPLSLASGKEVKVLSVMTMHFSQGDPALMIKYETATPLSDHANLGAEAEEVWTHFSAQADQAGLRNGILAATTPSKGGFVNVTQSCNFIYAKAADGSWHQTAKK